MEGASLLDAGMPEYAAHLKKMATLGMKLLPTAAGVAFDGTGWQGRINLDADDGRSFVELHESSETDGPYLCGQGSRSTHKSHQRLSFRRRLVSYLRG